jgi:hypothetical protein
VTKKEKKKMPCHPRKEKARTSRVAQFRSTENEDNSLYKDTLIKKKNTQKAKDEKIEIK